MAKAPRKQKSGGAKLKAAGKRSIMLGVTRQAHETLSRAAERENRSLANYVLTHSLECAKKLLAQGRLIFEEEKPREET